MMGINLWRFGVYCNPHHYKRLVVLNMRGFCLAGEKLRSLKSDLQISKSTRYELREIFIEAILNCRELSINFACTYQELSAIANGFTGKASEEIFSGCIGVIDGFLPQRKNQVKSNATAIKDRIIAAITGFMA